MAKSSSANQPQYPQIRAYQDYRSFLMDFAKLSRERNPRWSYGSWALKLGLKSKSQLTMTLQGRRKLSPNLMAKLIGFFKFTPDEESYFRRLVAIETKAKTTIHQVDMSEIAVVPKIVPKDAERTLLQNGWLSFVVKEAAAALGSQASSEKIANSIYSKPDAIEVDSLLKCLVETGYLTKKFDENGQVSFLPNPQSPQLNWTRESSAKLLSDGLQACDTQGRNLSPDERVLQTSFVRIRRERLAEARILIRSFQKEFMREMEEEGGNEILQLNLHLFPVTTGLKP